MLTLSSAAMFVKFSVQQLPIFISFWKSLVTSSMAVSASRNGKSSNCPTAPISLWSIMRGIGFLKGKEETSIKEVLHIEPWKKVPYNPADQYSRMDSCVTFILPLDHYGVWES